MKNNNSESKVTFPAFIGATFDPNHKMSKKDFYDLQSVYYMIRNSIRIELNCLEDMAIDTFSEFKPGDKVVVTRVNHYGKGRIAEDTVCFIFSINAKIPAREINSEVELDSIPFISYRFNKCKKNGTASLHEQWISMREIISIRLYDPEKDANLLNQK